MPERRPIASRNTRLATATAKWLSEKDVTPNQISQASVFFATMAGLAFWVSGISDGAVYVASLLIAAFGCQLRLACNLLDGMVAVEGGKGSPDGPFWNEAPDRLADALILVGLGGATGSWWLGWAAATAAVGTAYIRELGSAQGFASDFTGPMAKPQRMATATAGSVIAIFLPMVFGQETLKIVLGIIAIGTVITIVLRSQKLLKALRDASGE